MTESYLASKSGWGIGPLKDSALMILLWTLLFGLSGGPGSGALLGECTFLCGFFFFDKVLDGALDVFAGYGPITRKCARVGVLRRDRDVILDECASQIQSRCNALQKVRGCKQKTSILAVFAHFKSLSLILLYKYYKGCGSKCQSLQLLLLSQVPTMPHPVKGKIDRAEISTRVAMRSNGGIEVHRPGPLKHVLDVECAEQQADGNPQPVVPGAKRPEQRLRLTCQDEAPRDPGRVQPRVRPPFAFLAVQAFLPV